MSTVATKPPAQSGLREVVNLAWPLVVNNSVWTLQIAVDRAFLAQHDSRELAATLNAVVIFWSILNLFFYTVLYAGTFVAQYGGAGRPQRIGPAIGQALYCAVGGGVALLGLIPLGRPFFSMLQHEPAMQALEVQYFEILCWTALPTLITGACNSFFIGRGDSRTVLWISSAAFLVNAALDYVLVFGRFGFPELGIVGAGWATVCGQCVGTGIGLALLLKPRFRQEFRTDLLWKFEAMLFRRLLRYGLPNGAFTMLECASFAVFTTVIGMFGTLEAAASNMAFTLNLVAFLPAMGIGQAVEVLVGKYQGEERPDLSAQRTYMGFFLAWGFMVVMAIGYVTVPHLMLLPFKGEGTTDEVALATVLLRFVACYCLFDAGNSIFSFALRGAGDTRFVMRVVSALPWLGMVVPVFIVYELGGGIYGVWTVVSAYIAVQAFVFYWRFRHGAWRTMKVIESVSEEKKEDYHQSGGVIDFPTT